MPHYPGSIGHEGRPIGIIILTIISKTKTADTPQEPIY